jgi:hypothetical protein
MYSELQLAVRDFLKDEDDFDHIGIFAETPPTTPKDAQDALADSGIILVIGKPKQVRASASEVNVSMPIIVVENSEINSSKFKISPEQVLVDLIVNLDGYSTEGFWTPANVRQFQPSDPEFGLSPWGVMFETKTLLPRLFALLSDHEGNLISNEDDATFQTTNRGT